MLSVLANVRKLISFDTLSRKNFQKGIFVVELKLAD
jgi:hypothetical protein